MTVEEEAKQRSEHIKELILNKRLKEALEQIQIQMQGITDWSVISEYEDIEQSYNFMVQYFTQGLPDVQRPKQYLRLLRRIIMLNVSALRARLQPKSMLLYYQHLRSRLTNTESVENIKTVLDGYIDSGDNQQHERALETMFDLIWISEEWNIHDYNSVLGLIESPLIIREDAALAVSAVSLSLLESFDPYKFFVLSEAAKHSDVIISIRALTGLVLACHKYSDILPLFTEVKESIDQLAELPHIERRMLQVQIALFLCRETKEVDRRMREEIIPDMLRSSKLGDIMHDELESDGASPDWNEWMESSGLKNKMMQMNELQMEGADLYMSTFSHLKNYPFFKQIYNWFRVFTIEQPDVHASLGERFADTPFVKSILENVIFCNSDKYSFAFTLSHLSEEQRSMVMSQIDEPLNEELKNMGIAQLPLQEQEIFATRQYAQDIYRFYNLFSRRHEFYNPFSFNINILIDSPLSILVQSYESINTIASWLLDKNYFQEAIDAYKMMKISADPHSIDYRFYQQQGYAYQRIGDLEHALQSYKRADLLMPANGWTLRHTAQCLRLMNQHSDALDVLLHAEKLDPENLSLQIQIGDCLVDLKRYDDALSRFYKVDYLKPEYPKAWRAIAWCAFLACKNDRSIKYYDKLMEGKPTAHDYLNAGHTYLVDGYMNKCISCYHKSCSLMGKDKFIEEFVKDFAILKDKGICETDLSLIIDIV